MSVVGKSIGDTTPVSSVQPVALYDANTGQRGSVAVAGANGTGAATQANPLPVTEAQGLIISGPFTLAANVPATIIGAFADRRGMRVLNWTSAIVYLANGTTGTPPSGGGSDFIPAAVAGVPGQWSPPYAPVNGVRAVGSAAGDLTVTVW